MEIVSGCRIFALAAFLLQGYIVAGDDARHGDLALYRYYIAQVNVEDVPRAAIVDTGFTVCAVQGTEAEPAFPAIPSFIRSSFAINKTISVRGYHNIHISMAGFAERSVDFCEVNLLELSDLPQSGVSAIVGMNYLYDKTLVISGKQPCLLFQTPPPSLPECEVRMRFNQASVPMLPLRLPMQRMEVLLDTGSDSYMQLPPAVMSFLKREGHVFPADTREFETAGGLVTNQMYILRWAQLGENRFINVPVSEGTPALIGASLLRHLHCVFDFPNSRLYVEPLSDKLPIECQVDASGLRYSFEQDHRAYVRRFWKDYPAEKAGIQVGDELIAVDGVPVSQLSVHDIDATLCHAGKTVHLDLKSGERAYTVDLKLSRPYEYPPQWEPEQVAPPFPTLGK